MASRIPLLCFKNAWDPVFFARHDLRGKDDVPVVEEKMKLGHQGDPLTIFLEDPEDPRCSREADRVKEYCEGVSLNGLLHDTSRYGRRRGAWHDDRSSLNLTRSGSPSPCENLLTAAGLLRCLKKNAWTQRHLTYITNLSPEYILALALTAPFHQAPALRDAICKHVAFQSSIRVIIPSDGIPTFQMEFHLPLFALRRNPPPSDSNPRACGKRLRKWKDLSFLKGENSKSEDQEKWYIHEAHISCVVFGFDHWHWVAHGFVDTEHDGEDSDDEVTSSDDFNADPIARGLDANLPIGDGKPREYYLKVFETRVKPFKQEWSALIGWLQNEIHEYIQTHPFTCPDASRKKGERAEEIRGSFNWTLLAMQQLNEFHRVLSGVLRKWETFSSEGGDLGYFSDLDKFPTNSPQFREAAHAGRSLRSIKRAFDELLGLEQDLVLLKQSLIEFSRGLKPRLLLEGNQAVEHNGFTSEFAVWIQYPITLAAAIFSMQPSVIPFDLTPGWFCITVLIVMGAMFSVNWIMRKWLLWQKRNAFWTKMKQSDQESSRDVEKLYHDGLQFGDEFRGYLESLGLRAIPGRRSNLGNDISEMPIESTV